MWHYPAILHEDRVRRIYNNVQLRLPSAYAEEGSDSERLSEGRRSEAPSEDGALKAFRDCCNTSDTQKSLGEFHGSGKYGKDQPNERVEVWNVLKVPCIDSCLRHSETLIQHLASKSPHEAMKLRVFFQDAAVRLFGSADLGHVVADLSTGDGVDGETNEVGPHGSPAGMPAVLESRDPSGLIARALRGEDEESDDSAADDFRAMRKAVKDTERVKRWERHKIVGKNKVQAKLKGLKQVLSTLDALNICRNLVTSLTWCDLVTRTAFRGSGVEMFDMSTSWIHHVDWISECSCTDHAQLWS